MSGGHWDYLDRQFGWEVVENIPQDTPQRVALKKMLRLSIDALRAIDYNLSGDGDDREDELIEACVGKHRVLEAAIEMAERAREQLDRTIREAKNEI